MKVILLQDVARIGRKDEVKDVPAGYANNFLIPRKMAEPATPKNIARVEQRKDEIEREHAAQREAFEKVVTQTQEKTVTVAAQANDQGHLFKGLRRDEIAAAVSEQCGVTLVPESVVLDRPIKEVGEHTVTIASGGSTSAVTLSVVPA